MGNPAGFSYKMRNQKFKEAIGRVTLNVLTPPKIITNADTFDTIQNNKLIISKQSLTTNDVDPMGNYPLSIKNVHSYYGGGATIIGDNIEFTPTVITGKPAGFKYTVTNTKNDEVDGDVFINIKPLPDIDAYIWSSKEQLDNALTTIKPQTFKEIFDTWPKTDANSYFTGGGGTNWTLSNDISKGYRIYSTENSVNYISMISPEKLDNYTFDLNVGVDLSIPGTTTTGDDDMIGIVLAFSRINNINYALCCLRTGGGLNPTNGYGICLVTGNTYNVLKTYNLSKIGVWDNKMAKIKAIRDGDLFTCYTSEYSTPANINNMSLVANSKLEIDLNSDPILEKFKDKSNYGYCAHSQRFATFDNPKIVGGLNQEQMFLLTENNKIWIWNGITWEEDISKTVQQTLGYPRTVKNPLTNETFYIQENSITKL